MPSDQPFSSSPSHPRILIVARRTVRKNKYVDFVGEYHINLLQQYGAIPIIVPRTDATLSQLDHFEPIHGLLLTEGQDISPKNIPHQTFSPAALSAIAASHPSDADYDLSKDAIELALINRCLSRRIPILAICRGSQLLNITCGGSIIQDIDTVLNTPTHHIDYQNYDQHRHPIHITPSTPLSTWFPHPSISVNSYHHQGIEKLAPCFHPMAHAPDGLIEAFYDPLCFAPSEGRFLVGLQFHPERMQDAENALRDQPPIFDYPGCSGPYITLVRAAKAFQRAESPHKYHALRSSRSFRNIPCSHVASRFSRSELDRVAKYGGTVHGATLLKGLLEKENAPEVQALGGECDSEEWRAFCSALIKLGSAMEALTMSENIGAAVDNCR